MARALKESPLTPADELRSLLTELERRLADTRLSQTQVITMMEQMDRVAELIPALQAAKVDLRPELGRLDGIEAGFRRHAGRLARAAGPALAARRQETGAPAARWWWYVDAIVRQQQWQRLRRLGVAAAAVALVVLFFVVIFPILFPVDPAISRAQQFAADGELAVMNGDYAAALEPYRQAADTLPTDPTYRIWVGVLAETLGQTDEAEAAFAQARRLVDNEAQFFVLRGQSYLQLNAPAKALADSDAALALNPESAQAYFVRASALESLGRTLEAIDAFETTAALASAQNDATLTVLARVRLGYLLQGSFGPPPAGEATPTP